MNNFKTPYEKVDSKTVKVTLQPDKEGLRLAQIQNNFKDKNERSMIDILMQSAIMNLGSGGTYNSLLDKRDKSIFSQDDSGLVEEEIKFAKEILTGVPTHNTLYQSFDGKQYKFDKSKKEIKQEITNALKRGENVVIGYIFEIGDGKYSGHEITIIGQTNNLKGESFFVCQDSSDDKSTPVAMSEEFLLSSIHHASFADKNQQSLKMASRQPINNISPLVGQLVTNEVFVFDNNIITPWSKPQVSFPTMPLPTEPRMIQGSFPQNFIPFNIPNN